MKPLLVFAAFAAPAPLDFAAFAAPPTDPYADAYARARASGQPLYVFVGQPAQDVPGAVSVRSDAFPAAQTPSVVIGRWDGAGRMDREDWPGVWRGYAGVTLAPGPVRPVTSAVWSLCVGGR